PHPAGSARLVARHTIRHRTGRCHAPPPKSVVDGGPRRRYRTAGESSPPVGEPRCGHGPHVPSVTSPREPAPCTPGPFPPQVPRYLTSVSTPSERSPPAWSFTMSWLVTGAGGMLGSDLADALTGRGAAVTPAPRPALAIHDAAAVDTAVRG